MAASDAFGDGDSSVQSWRSTPGTGKYLNARTKDFLKERLDIPSGGNWYKLAIQLDIFTDMEIQRLETLNLRPGGSPTLELLRIYEQRKGGVDEEHFIECLDRSGRHDIITDLIELHVDEEGKPYPLTETRHPRPTTPKRVTCTPPPSGPTPPSSLSQTVPQSPVSPNVQDVVLEGTMRIIVEQGTIVSQTPVNENGHSEGAVTPPARQQNCSHCHNASAIADSSVGAEFNGLAPPPQDVRKRQPSPDSHQTGRPNSDPIQRRLPNQDSMQGDANAPRNLRGTISSPSVGENHQEEQVHVVVHSGMPVVASQREEEQMQQTRDYSSLNSYSSLEGVVRGVKPSPVQQDRCFVISTIAQKDMAWFEKICRSLRNKNIDVHSVHDASPLKDKLYFFSQANFVLVVYTGTYEAEIKSEGSDNWRFFQEMKAEYRRNGNINKRFVPVFEPRETEMMPNPLLRCEDRVHKKATALLTPCNSRNFIPASPANRACPQNNLSPPSTGSTMNNRSALGGQRSQSAPHIVCESHTHRAPSPPRPKKKRKPFWKIGK